MNTNKTQATFTAPVRSHIQTEVGYKRIMAQIMIATTVTVSGLFLLIDFVFGGPIRVNAYIALFITLSGVVLLATVAKLLKGSGWIIR